MMITVKIHHNSDGATILAGCDKAIVGKTFEQDNLVLTVAKSFFSEEDANEDRFIILAKRADIINIVGVEITTLAIKNNLINKESLKIIQGIPHCQIFKNI